MKAAALVVKTVMDNSELKKGLKENEELLKKQAEYEEKIAYWQKDKERHERLLKENQDKETDTYLQTRKENIAYAEENIKFYEKQIEKLKELNKEQQKNNSLQSVSNLSAKTSNVSDLLDTKTIEEDDSVGNKVKKANVLGTALKKALTFGKGLGKAMLSVLATIAKISIAIVGIGVLLGGLSVGIAILGAGFKKAFENEQIKANLDYIKFAIGQAIVPLAEKLANIILKIINLLIKVLQYIQLIIYKWTGRNIFENAGVDAYAKSLKKASDNMKELNKQTASFDEMDILSDNKGASNEETSGGMPNYDLSQIQDIEVPSWMQWIFDNGDMLASILLGIAGAIVAIKLGADALKATGIGLTIMGIVYAIKSFIEYSKDPSLNNFGKIIEGIAIAIIGLGILIFGLPAIIGGVILLIFGIIMKYWDQIKSFLKTNVVDWLEEKSNWIHEHLGGMIGMIYNTFVDNIKGIIIWFDFLFQTVKGIFDNIISFIKNVFTGNWRGAFEDLKSIVKSAFDFIVFTIQAAFRGIANLALSILERAINWPIEKLNGLIGTLNSYGMNMSKIPSVKLPRLAKGTILNNPGKGVPVASGSAIAGEAGREAYLPLSDEQLLEELGSTIGRHITINLTNINKLNGRVLNREVKKIRNEDEFAYNG